MVHDDAIARLIHDAFADYHARFAEITQRAKVRFEAMDWTGARADAVERIELYDQCIAECALRLQSALLGQAHDRTLWITARAAFEMRQDEHSGRMDGGSGIDRRGKRRRRQRIGQGKVGVHREVLGRAETGKPTGALSRTGRAQTRPGRSLPLKPWQ